VNFLSLQHLLRFQITSTQQESTKRWKTAKLEANFCRDNISTRRITNTEKILVYVSHNKEKQSSLREIDVRESKHTDRKRGGNFGDCLLIIVELFAKKF
jgi:hypothetical protein